MTVVTEKRRKHFLHCFDFLSKEISAVYYALAYDDVADSDLSTQVASLTLTKRQTPWTTDFILLSFLLAAMQKGSTSCPPAKSLSLFWRWCSAFTATRLFHFFCLTKWTRTWTQETLRGYHITFVESADFILLPYLTRRPCLLMVTF